MNGPIRNFSYDYRGNVISDGKVTVNEYDHRNMALNVTTPSGVAVYNYDDGGNRLAKKVGSTWEYYLHDQTGRELAVIDVNTGKLKQVNLFGNDQIGSVDITWGADSATYNKQYYIKDHLGSIRIAKSSSGSILSARNYYPYGETMQEYQSGTKNRKYRFTGKERDDETNQDYFGARYYDSELGRWNTVDPLAGKYLGLSPYNYCINRPLNIIDPNGMEGILLDDYGEGGEPKTKKVAIDPGHGDHNDKNSQVDPGAVSGEDKEKDLALAVANGVSAELKAAGIEASETRNGDVTNAGKKLVWRVKKAGEADIFVSVHTNANDDPKANGFSVCYNPSSSESLSLAQSIQNSNTVFTNKGVSARPNLYVLKAFNGPSVLVEAGFISNNNDLKKLKTQYNQIGKDIANGIIKYIKGK